MLKNNIYFAVAYWYYTTTTTEQKLEHMETITNLTLDIFDYSVRTCNRIQRMYKNGLKIY